MIMVIGPHKRKADTKADRAAPRPGPRAQGDADRPVPSPRGARDNGPGQAVAAAEPAEQGAADAPTAI